MMMILKKRRLIFPFLFAFLAVIWLSGCEVLTFGERKTGEKESASSPGTAGFGLASAEQAVDPDSQFLVPVPNRDGFYIEPGNYDGLIFTNDPPGTAIRSPYTKKMFLVPDPDIYTSLSPEEGGSWPRRSVMLQPNLDEVVLPSER